MLIAEQELLRSCEVLFGRELNLSCEFLGYLQHSGIKTAYRRKAKETHPDLVSIRHSGGQKPPVDVFQSVHNAYENLMRYVEARETGYRFPFADKQATGTKPPSTSAKKASCQPPEAGTRRRNAYSRSKEKDFALYRGEMPSRELLFGHFLYYSGIITWLDIVNALVWQRTHRPRLGELGRKHGWLKEQDIPRIIDHNTALLSFGESAVRLGLLSERQRNTLLFQQTLLQKKFGLFFIEKGTMSAAMLDCYLKKFNFHNACARRKRSRNS